MVNVMAYSTCCQGTSLLASGGFDLKVNYNSVEGLVVLFELKGVATLSLRWAFYLLLENDDCYYSSSEPSVAQR